MERNVRKGTITAKDIQVGIQMIPLNIFGNEIKELMIVTGLLKNYKWSKKKTEQTKKIILCIQSAAEIVKAKVTIDNLHMTSLVISDEIMKTMSNSSLFSLAVKSSQKRKKK